MKKNAQEIVHLSTSYYPEGPETDKDRLASAWNSQDPTGKVVPREIRMRLRTKGRGNQTGGGVPFGLSAEKL